MMPIIALGVLTVVAAGAYIKVGMDELRLIEEATKERERKERKNRSRQRRRYNKR